MLRALVLVPLMFCQAMGQAGPSATKAATAEERLVVLEMSTARLHPRDYARWLRTQMKYFDGNLWKLPDHIPIQTMEGAAPLTELLAFLEQAPSLGPLHWSEGLSRAARRFTLEQGPTGQTGHTGPAGSTLQSRTLTEGLFQSLLGEVINYGAENPRWTVMQLLIDDGVPGRGHRNAIFNPGFHFAGAATGPHAAYGEMTVVDLADGFSENPD